MMDLSQASINTAGAYVRVNGYYPFSLGAQPYQGRLPVVRLGGHREGKETGWQCAVREVHEEIHLHIQPLTPQVTYFLPDGDQPQAELEAIPLEAGTGGDPAPCLVVAYHRQDQLLLSLMYLAQAQGNPRPFSEVKGLLLLREEEIHRICRSSITLEQYLHDGGKAIFEHDYDRSMLLEPFLQLRILSRILLAHNDPA